MKLDSRQFSKAAYEGLTALRNGDRDTKRDHQVNPKDWEKASNLIKGLPAYIATWGLHRLGGDAKKFLDGAQDTKYKGKVYLEFLFRLQSFSKEDLQLDDDKKSIDEAKFIKRLIDMPSREYIALNHLAIQLAKEWSFWAASVLEDGK